MEISDVSTPFGVARVHFAAVDHPLALLVLGHGAGGGIGAPDLVRVTEVANREHVAVALVEQPYRVTGRRAPAPARQLDGAWQAVVTELRTRAIAPAILVGGRSSGARVACRTAADVGAVGVLCLAFPLSPPQRAPSRERPNRLPELDAVSVPTLVVQGGRDPFGIPPEAPGRTVVEVAGDHSLKADLDAVGEAVRHWLHRVKRRARQP